MDDVLIIGGGVMGLSLAYDLSRHAVRVRVLDRASPGMESSWAGAGILPPAVLREADHPLEQLTGLSHALHAQWAGQLQQQTGIDTGYQRCGGLYLARHEQGAEELRSWMTQQTRRGIEVQWLSPAEVRQCEPALTSTNLTAACLLPDECQLRNPRHVKALMSACHQQGVAIQAGAVVDRFQTRGGRIVAALAGSTAWEARQFCIAGGAWSSSLLERLGCSVPVRPLRGQIVLISGPGRVLQHVVNDGECYLVPRPDGRVLVGSTVEDAGFDKRNTAEAVGELLRFAVELAQPLRDHTVERTWAGLRPGTADGLPYLGRIPELDNAFVATGHFRQGLHLSTGTAVVMSQLLRGEPAQINLSPFRIDR